MYEDYLLDSHYFAKLAEDESIERNARRFYRVATFCCMAAIEAYIYFVAEALYAANRIDNFEFAFLSDKKYELANDHFVVTDKSKYSKFEEKLRLLIAKFAAGFDFGKDPNWSWLLDLKRLRDSITHPKTDEDETLISDYKKKVSNGISAAIYILNGLCKGIFKKELRKGLLELK